mmetsp:Transcript_52062/g.131599  ORF Transcript_52062/g.131599 Transcript_52062/m.131599 type:complete len:365 (+) Transcript_52062:96-1190(+)
MVAGSLTFDSPATSLNRRHLLSGPLSELSSRIPSPQPARMTSFGGRHDVVCKQQGLCKLRRLCHSLPMFLTATNRMATLGCDCHKRSIVGVLNVAYSRATGSADICLPALHRRRRDVQHLCVRRLTETKSAVPLASKALRCCDGNKIHECVAKVLLGCKILHRDIAIVVLANEAAPVQLLHEICLAHYLGQISHHQRCYGAIDDLLGHSFASAGLASTRPAAVCLLRSFAFGIKWGEIREAQGFQTFLSLPLLRSFRLGRRGFRTRGRTLRCDDLWLRGLLMKRLPSPCACARRAVLHWQLPAPRQWQYALPLIHVVILLAGCVRPYGQLATTTLQIALFHHSSRTVVETHTQTHKGRSRRLPN